MNTNPRREGMSIIVRTVARWLKGFILLYGISVVLYGHITTGGGFEGGVIIAIAFVLLALAEGEQASQSFFSKRAASTLVSAGVLLFLALAFAGMLWGDGIFFENFIDTKVHALFTLFSGGVIPLLNIGLGLMVASSLFLVFTVLAALRIRDKGEEDS